MKHDYESARRGAVIEGKGKTRITMYLDDDVIEHFRERGTINGRGYQTEINAALRDALGRRAAAQGDEIADITTLKSQVGELVRAVGRIEKSVHVAQYARVKHVASTIRENDSSPRYAAKGKRAHKSVKGA
jgi:hypothetical protein